MNRDVKVRRDISVCCIYEYVLLRIVHRSIDFYVVLKFRNIGLLRQTNFFETYIDCTGTPGIINL
jgi:hypothetical protein